MTPVRLLAAAVAASALLAGCAQASSPGAAPGTTTSTTAAAATSAPGTSSGVPMSTTTPPTSSSSTPGAGATSPNAAEGGQVAADAARYLTVPGVQGSAWTIFPGRTFRSGDTLQVFYRYNPAGLKEPPCTLRAIVRGRFTGSLDVNKAASVAGVHGARNGTVVRAEVTHGEGGMDATLSFESTGEKSVNGVDVPFHAFNHAMVTPGGTLVDAMGVSNDDTEDRCHLRAAVEGLRWTGVDAAATP